MSGRSRTYPRLYAVAAAAFLGGLSAALSPLDAQTTDRPGVSFEERFSPDDRAHPVFTRPEIRQLLASLPPSAAGDETIASAEAPAGDMAALLPIPFAELTGPARVLDPLLAQEPPVLEAEAQPAAPAQVQAEGQAQAEGSAPAQAGAPSETPAEARPIEQAQLPEPEMPPPPPPAEVVLPPEPPAASSETASRAPASAPEPLGESPTVTSSVHPSRHAPTDVSQSPSPSARIAKKHAAKEHGRQPRHAARAPASAGSRLVRDLGRELSSARRQVRSAFACGLRTGCMSRKQIIGTAAGAIAGGAAGGAGGAVAGGAAGAILTAPK